MKYPILSLGLLALLLSACVSQKQYDTLLKEKMEQDDALGEMGDQLAAQSAELDRLRLQKTELFVLRDSLQVQVTQSRTQVTTLETELAQLQNRYNALRENSSALNTNVSQTRQRLMQMEEDLVLAQQRLEDTRTSLNQREASLNALGNELQTREQRVNELERILAEKDAAVNTLKNQVANALLAFTGADSTLTIDVRNGKVYVSLAEDLLFGSGSITVSPKGAEALKKLGNALKDSDINILVEGHTDNVPIGRTSRYMNDNWDLSVLRATTVTRLLIEAGVETTRITPAGRGEHVPLVENNTRENKAKNRRTEIILTPKLDEIFKILEGN